MQWVFYPKRPERSAAARTTPSLRRAGPFAHQRDELRAHLRDAHDGQATLKQDVEFLKDQVSKLAAASLLASEEGTISS
jgi:hypothetical protein